MPKYPPGRPGCFFGLQWHQRHPSLRRKRSRNNVIISSGYGHETTRQVEGKRVTWVTLAKGERVVVVRVSNAPCSGTVVVTPCSGTRGLYVVDLDDGSRWAGAGKAKYIQKMPPLQQLAEASE